MVLLTPMLAVTCRCKMKDLGYHILLAIAIGIIGWLLFKVLPPLTAGAVLGSMVTYLREVTQRQTNKDLDFRQGWAFWLWYRDDGTFNWQKVVETVGVWAIIPVALAGDLILRGLHG